jgi:hypothetical protein
MEESKRRCSLVQYISPLFARGCVALSSTTVIAGSPVGTARDWWRPASSRASAAGKRRPVFVSFLLLLPVSSSLADDPARRFRPLSLLSTPTRPFRFVSFRSLFPHTRTCTTYMRLVRLFLRTRVRAQRRFPPTQRQPPLRVRPGLRPGPPNPTNSCVLSVGVPPARPTRLEQRLGRPSLTPSAPCAPQGRTPRGQRGRSPCVRLYC